MKLKKVKVLLMALLVLISALSINLCALATEGDDDFVIEEIPTEAPTESPTEAPTSAPTEAPTTQRPTEAPTTTRPVYRPTYTPTTPSTTQATVSTGSGVKLELNNGEEAIYAEVSGSGLVTVPAAPKKEGFKFDGWYSDELFTERWDFLTSKATEDTVLYAKWVSLQDDSLFSITVSTNLGGVVTVEPTRAAEGEIVTITVTPDKGNRLVENSLSVNGKFIDEYTFEMPASNVIVEAQFESVAEVEEDKSDEATKMGLGKILTIVAIAIVVIGVIIWLIVNRYRFLPEEEEDELFFVEPMSGQPAIRHDDFVRNKRNQLEKKQAPQIHGQEYVDENASLEMNEDAIRKINKTGNINLDE